MDIKRIKSLFIGNFQNPVRVAVMLLTVLTTTGAWAQTTTSVSTETELKNAITNGANIQLTENIQLNNYLNIEGVTVTIDLNGHKLSRNLNSYGSEGHVIWAHNGSNLTLTSSVAGGSIEGGMANNGGAIHIPHGNTVTANNITFRNNSAAGHAGAIWNNGTFTATDCKFENNTAKDVGAIYNSVEGEYAGSATLTNCTFTGNVGTLGAGALANAVGNTVMTINGGTITDNTADTYGAGIWNGGTLNMKGTITVKDNMNVGGVPSNVYLKNGTVITVTGSLTGSDIGVELESTEGTFTKNYSNYDHGSASLFTADRSSILGVGYTNNEAILMATVPGSVYYIERSWDDTNKKVVSTEKSITELIAYDVEPDGTRQQYKEVTNAPADTPDEWFGMGGYSDDVPEYYVVRGDVNRQTIVVQGKDVHLILCNGATLTLTGGLKLEGDTKLHIHSQSYGGDMGRLMVTCSYAFLAGIGGGSYGTTVTNQIMSVGELVVHGGHIEAEGGKESSGIGSSSKAETGSVFLDRCNRVTVFGGYVEATGGENSAGIGGGVAVNGGDLFLYDGTVIAKGGATGVGGGKYGYGGNVVVYGGSLTAYGGNGAGIGSGLLFSAHREKLTGGTLTVFGGSVEAHGSGYSAGIGGGKDAGGAKVIIYDGTVTAVGGEYGSGIGGGYYGIGGDVTITGGTVTAFGGDWSAGIGGGEDHNGGTVTISGGTVTAIGGERGAGIGGGNAHAGGTVTISGGTVTATGGEKAAGIGGGRAGGGGDVTITGGIVKAKAGNQGGEGYRAIGPGKGKDKYGTLVIGDMMMVGAGNNGSVERVYNADERVNACWFRSYAETSPCTHPSGITYTINEDDTHTSHCKHCSLSEKAAHFNSDGNGTCICGYKEGEGYCTITIATSNGTGYEGVGVIANVGNDKPYTLPVCSTIPEGYDFAGWAVNPTSHNGIQPCGNETLLQAGENIIVTGDVSIFARYQTLGISLADDSDNSEKLHTYNGKKATRVTLTGRTLWKDGEWNTLCLPFNLADFSGTPLEGATVKTLASSDYNATSKTLTLHFGNVTAIEAGKPYLVMWAEGTEISDPVFRGVTIVKGLKDVTTDFVTFKGLYGPYESGEKNDLFYLGADNQLSYPESDMTILAQRAYFQLTNGVVPFLKGDVNGDKTTSVADVMMMVDYCLGLPAEGFLSDRADLNDDGIISVVDVMALVDIILLAAEDQKVVIDIDAGDTGIGYGDAGTGPAHARENNLWDRE